MIRFLNEITIHSIGQIWKYISYITFIVVRFFFFFVKYNFQSLHLTAAFVFFFFWFSIISFSLTHMVGNKKYRSFFTFTCEFSKLHFLKGKHRFLFLFASIFESLTVHQTLSVFHARSYHQLGTFPFSQSLNRSRTRQRPPQIRPRQKNGVRYTNTFWQTRIDLSVDFLGECFLNDSDRTRMTWQSRHVFFFFFFFLQGRFVRAFSRFFALKSRWFKLAVRFFRVGPRGGPRLGTRCAYSSPTFGWQKWSHHVEFSSFALDSFDTVGSLRAAASRTLDLFMQHEPRKLRYRQLQSTRFIF